MAATAGLAVQQHERSAWIKTLTSIRGQTGLAGRSAGMSRSGPPILLL